MFSYVPYRYRKIFKAKRGSLKPFRSHPNRFLQSFRDNVVFICCTCLCNISITFLKSSYNPESPVFHKKRLYSFSYGVSTKINFADYVGNVPTYRFRFSIEKGECEADLDVIYIRTNKRTWAKQSWKSCSCLYWRMCEVESVSLTVNSMVLFSCKLVGWTPVAPSAARRWSSGERPFSSNACRNGKLWSLLKNRGRFPPPSAPSFVPFPNWKKKKDLLRIKFNITNIKNIYLKKHF